MATTFTVTMDDAGKLGISGPLEDKIYCLGLLELAKSAVHEFHSKAKAKTTLVVIPDVNVDGRVG